jgi:hypothetical protein
VHESHLVRLDKVREEKLKQLNIWKQTLLNLTEQKNQLVRVKDGEIKNIIIDFGNTCL